MALASISLAALLSVTAPAVANAAIQQVQSNRADGFCVLDDEEGPSQRCAIEHRGRPAQMREIAIGYDRK
jgi:hypothetical protein